MASSGFASTYLAPSPQVRQELLLGHLVQLGSLGCVVGIGEVERLSILVEENRGLDKVLGKCQSKSLTEKRG